MVEAPAVPKKLEDLVPMMQQVQADLTRLADSFAEVQESYIRTHEYFRVLGMTAGDVTVGAGGGAAIKFPEAGQTGGWRSFMRSGKVMKVMVHNTGQHPAYVNFNQAADVQSALIVAAGAWRTFEVEVTDYVSVCSTDATDTTTVRVAVFGE